MAFLSLVAGSVAAARTYTFDIGAGGIFLYRFFPVDGIAH
jgi:hypothetical protein